MTQSRLSRRRFLSISASAIALPAIAQAEASAHWRGVALGAPAKLHLVGITEDEAQPIFRAVEQELQRLESIFSLYRSDSALSRLNREGRLAMPPHELLEVLSLSGAIWTATGGAFDPTIQPLWQAHAAQAGRAPDLAAIKAAQAKVGWQKLRLDSAEIGFAEPGMALSLNGIAQGAITDQIATRLAELGLTNVLVDMGEISARGTGPDHAPWTVGIATPGGEVLTRIQLRDQAIASSAGAGTMLSAETGHILSPQDGRTAPLQRFVSVSAPRAALADGLSTAGCLMTDVALDRAVAAFPGAKLQATA